MSEAKSKFVADDFDAIREHLEKIKKEQEDAAKQTSNAPQETAETPGFDYCVQVGSDMDYCLGYNELSTGPRPIMFKCGECEFDPDFLWHDHQIRFYEDLHLTEDDEIMNEEEVAFLYKLGV